MFLQHILNTEENWNSWKNEGCPSFVKERYLSFKVEICHLFEMMAQLLNMYVQCI